ncbi:MAG: phosphatidylglycerol lysyltransferase domain-containing protein [Planctomycetes bacterium]|nr:phosphatidylglycerol lysyltransferase domain-containing protein [Planctomycetota bacterium]
MRPSLARSDSREAPAACGASTSDAPGAGTMPVAHLQRAAEIPCDLAPANLVLWEDCEVPSFDEVHGCICVRVTPRHLHEPAHHLEPVPFRPEADVVAALDDCISSTGLVSRVRAPLARLLPQDRFAVAPMRDHFDYVFDRADLAEMRGTRHDGHRNQMRKFEREHPRHEFRALAPGDAPEALAAFDSWAAEHDDSAPDATDRGPAALSVSCQRRAIERAFDNFARLGLVGGVISEDGSVRAFLLASTVGDTAFAHFQYAVAPHPGIYQTLLRACCRSVLADRAFVNLEEDLGVPGLRRAKLAYHPLRFVEKYEVRRKRT